MYWVTTAAIIYVLVDRLGEKPEVHFRFIDEVAWIIQVAERDYRVGMKRST